MPEELISPLEKLPPMPASPVSPESVPSLPETGVELKRPEKPQAVSETAIAEAASPNSIVSLTNAQQQLREEERAIEKILEKDLEDVYLNLPPDKQREFRAKGEEAAKKINILLHKAKIQVKKIIDVIKKWLSLIPGVNKFFLEQEAKIRADAILRLKK